jgi:hypothetical protein
MQLVRLRHPEPCERALRCNGLLHEVHVAIEMEPERFGTGSSHRDDRGKVALFASAHHRHRSPMTRALAPRVEDAIKKRSLGADEADHASASAVMDCRQDRSGLSDS